MKSSLSLQVYVLHCKSLTDRRIHIEKTLKSLEIEPTWIVDHDANELKDYIKNEYHVNDLKEAFNRTVKIWSSGHPTRPLTDTEISLAIKHTIAMKSIAEGKEEYALILEDDCLFRENFDSLFSEYLGKTPADWDIIHVGDGYGMKPENYYEAKEIAYRMKHPASRCAEAILVKKEAAVKISKTMKPFYLAADWELGYQYWLHNLNVYWWEPSLITQGSHSGAFKSSLR